MASGAPQGDNSKYVQEATAKGETPLNETAWKAQAVMALVQQLAAGDTLGAGSASAASAQPQAPSPGS
eukprot:7273544-Alexandrium_andersonii.AAC.1